MNKGKNIFEKIKHPGMFMKILLLFEVTLIVTIILTSSYIINRFAETVIEMKIVQGDTNLDKMTNYCNEKYNRIYSLYNYIHGGEIAELMENVVTNPETAYSIENIDLASMFSKAVVSADQDISDVILISVNGTVFSYSAESYPAVKPSFDFLSHEEIEKFIKSERNIKVVYDNPDVYALKSREAVISFLGKIYNPGMYPKKELLGIFIMNVPLNKIAEQDFMQRTIVDDDLILLNEENRVLFSTQSEGWDTEVQVENIKTDAEYHVNIKEIGTSGMKAVYLLPKQSILNEINQINQQIYTMMVIAILITLIITLTIYRIFNYRAQTLIQSMKQLQKGDFSLRIPVKSKDEIGEISQAFNEMCEQLNIYISRVYAAEIQRKNAQLNALQTQIDPHFLYNTLDSIKAVALSKQDEETAEMIVLLGKLFRWSSRTKEKFVTLENELEYIETYLNLQKYRYQECLEVDIQVNDGQLDYLVPKLILQPLVENVIQHAFADKLEKGLVGITVKDKDAIRLEITIFDNGIGIEKEKLQEMCNKLSQQIEQDAFKSIGLQNVQERIKLLFGEEYGLDIKSISGLGTAVKVVLPIIKEGNL